MANELQKLWQTQYAQLLRNQKVISNSGAKTSFEKYNWENTFSLKTETEGVIQTGTVGGAIQRYLASLSAITGVLDNTAEVFGRGKRGAVYQLMCPRSEFGQLFLLSESQQDREVVRSALGDMDFARFLARSNLSNIDVFSDILLNRDDGVIRDDEGSDVSEKVTFLLHALYMNIEAVNLKQLCTHILDNETDFYFELRDLRPKNSQAILRIEEDLDTFISKFNKLAEEAFADREYELQLAFAQILPVLETSFQSLRVQREEGKIGKNRSFVEIMLHRAAERLIENEFSGISEDIRDRRFREFLGSVLGVLRFSSVAFLYLCNDLGLSVDGIIGSDFPTEVATGSAKGAKTGTLARAMRKLVDKSRRQESVLVTDIWDEELALSILSKGKHINPITVVYSIGMHRPKTVFRFPY